jgi:hypothetical protein
MNKKTIAAAFIAVSSATLMLSDTVKDHVFSAINTEFSQTLSAAREQDQGPLDITISDAVNSGLVVTFLISGNFAVNGRRKKTKLIHQAEGNTPKPQ